MLSACTGPAATSPAPSASATASVPTAAPTTPSATPTTGPQPLPAADGRPMLWRVGTTVSVQDRWGRFEATRYGFVDVTGKLVVRPRYEGFDYCRDSSGRVDHVIGTATARKADILDLTGRVVARTPTTSADCGPPGFVIFRRWSGGELGIHRDGLLEIATGRIVVPMVKGRHIALVNEATVNISEAGGEYFLNPETGARTPHAGWLTSDTTLEPGAPGLPATATRPDTEGDDEYPKVGFVSLAGTWAYPATLAEADGFEDGHAIIRREDDTSTFLDTRLKTVGGDWTDLWSVGRYDGLGWHVAGYQAGVADDDQTLLGTDLKALVRSASAIDCASGDDVVCTVTAADGTRSIHLLPEGTTIAMPAGYTKALNASLVVDADEANDGAAGRLLSLQTGTVVPVGTRTACEPVDSAWAVCQNPDADSAPAVFDASGRRTAFTAIDPLYDPSPPGGVRYYRVSTPRYQGIVDTSGTWLYRQSAFTQLED